MNSYKRRIEVLWGGDYDCAEAERRRRIVLDRAVKILRPKDLEAAVLVFGLDGRGERRPDVAAAMVGITRPALQSRLGKGSKKLMDPSQGGFTEEELIAVGRRRF
jgi:hypothetical protein